MFIKKIVINSKLKEYEVYFTKTSDFLTEYLNLPSVIFIVDETVWQYHKNTSLAQLANQDVILLTVNENRKCLSTVEELYDKVMERAPKKNLKIVAIGGGITQDITGFLASTLYRGVDWVFVPTTLLAQADSSIGSKTSLNFKKFKNLIGTFYPPNVVIQYAGFLKTQAQDDFFSGLGEVVKLYIMGGKDKVNSFITNQSDILKREPDLLAATVSECLEIKKNYIENDEFDRGRRNLLNYGHCFGHAIESATDFRVSHGQAVILGMILANKVAVGRGLLAEKQAEFLEQKLLKPFLRVDVKNYSAYLSSIVEGLKHDKKRIGQQFALIMLKNDYSLIKVDNLSESEVAQVLTDFRVE